MQFKINRIETYGMKNLSKPICVDFQNQTYNNNKSKDLSVIKAIYGSNGSGKSAFIRSVDLYKSLMSKKNCLYQDFVQEELSDLINQKTNKYFFSIIFNISFKNDDKYINKILKHEIVLKKDENVFYLAKDSLSILNDQTINGQYNNIYTCNEGILTFGKKYSDKATDYLINITSNLLKLSSLNSFFDNVEIVRKILDIIKDSKQQNIDVKSSFIIMTPYLLSEKINTYLDESDLHVSNNGNMIEKMLDDMYAHKEYFKNKISSDEDLIRKEDFIKYKKQISKLCLFIKVFKQDLLDIKIETKEDKYYYHCKKILIYKDYKVESSNESTGIKKLMRIFNSVVNVTRGNISFIDELDSNISPVYLNKLLEYIQRLGKGQLCFTTHNMFAMNYLYSFSHSIDFLGETGVLVPWKKNGNYKPYNKYPEGMILDSPFNVDYFDFIKVFESEGE